jgi:hypothetical protein
MEHCWHVLTVIVVSHVLLAAIVLMPPIRLEGLAFYSAAILGLYLSGHRKAAGTVFKLLAGALFVYAVLMTIRMVLSLRGLHNRAGFFM